MQVLIRFTIRAAVLLAVISGMYSCGYDDFRDYDPPLPENIVPNVDIATLHGLYETGGAHIYDDLIIGGYVTANDRSGNIYRSFFIEDHSGAIEVKAGPDGLHNRFPLGRYVAVKAGGLRLGSYNGVLEIGLRPDDGSFYETDYFGHRAVMDMYVVLGGGYSVREPHESDISGLAESLCGRLVRINGLKFVAEPGAPLSWAFPRGPGTETPQTGYRVFEDGAGGTITVVTSGYANFAGAEIPLGTISLTGILSYGKAGTGTDSFILKLRDINDVGEF